MKHADRIFPSPSWIRHCVEDWMTGESKLGSCHHQVSVSEEKTNIYNHINKCKITIMACLSTEEWINKLRYLHTVEPQTARRMKICTYVQQYG